MLYYTSRHLRSSTQLYATSSIPTPHSPNPVGPDVGDAKSRKNQNEKQPTGPLTAAIVRVAWLSEGVGNGGQVAASTDI